MAVTAVSNIADLVTDYTIDPSGSGGGVAAIPVTRLWNATLPLRVNAGASADGNADQTWSVNTFGAAASGIVPLSGGGTTNFLRADGTWANPVGSGGYTTIQEEGGALTQRGVLNFIGADITAADNAGSSRTDVTIARFTSVTGGTVPASGGGSTTFLRADGTWVTPSGAGGGVTLQGTHPGSTDSGSAHISSWMQALVYTNSSAASTRSNNTAIQIESNGANDGIRIEAPRGSTPANVGGLGFFQYRNTLGSPTSTVSGTVLGKIRAGGINTSSAEVIQDPIWFQAGTVTASDVPADLRLRGGPATDASATFAWLNTNGMKVGPNLASIPTISNTLEILGSLGLRVELFSGATASYNVGATSCIHVIDASAVTPKQFTLPTAVGIAGRTYGFCRSDATAANIIQLITTGGQTIGGQTGNFTIRLQGEAVLITSDGSNWQIIGQNILADRNTLAADSSAVSNTVTNTFVANWNLDASTSSAGAVAKVYAAGKFSTTGTPTLRFSIQNQNGDVLSDSGAVTCPAGVTNAVWQLEFQGTARDSTHSRLAGGRLYLAQAAGIGASMLVYNMSDQTLGLTTGGMLPDKLFVQWGTASASNTVTLLESIVSFQPNTQQV